MIRERAYPVDPWHIRETRLDLDLLAQSESVFALANGHIGIRGNLDEGEPHGLLGRGRDADRAADDLLRLAHDRLGSGQSSVRGLSGPIGGRRKVLAGRAHAGASPPSPTSATPWKRSPLATCRGAPEPSASAMAEARVLHKRLLAGADFHELARLHSADRSAAAGGAVVDLPPHHSA